MYYDNESYHLSTLSMCQKLTVPLMLLNSHSPKMEALAFCFTVLKKTKNPEVVTQDSDPCLWRLN